MRLTTFGLSRCTHFLLSVPIVVGNAIGNRCASVVTTNELRTRCRMRMRCIVILFGTVEYWLCRWFSRRCRWLRCYRCLCRSRCCRRCFCRCRCSGCCCRCGCSRCCCRCGCSRCRSGRRCCREVLVWHNYLTFTLTIIPMGWQLTFASVCIVVKCRGTLLLKRFTIPTVKKPTKF